MAIENDNNASIVRDAMNPSNDNNEGRRNGGGERRERRDDRSNERDDRDERREDREPRRAGNTAGLGAIGRMNPTPLAMSSTAEALERFRADFVEAMPKKDSGNMINASVFPIDASLSGIPFSLLVVAGTHAERQKLGVGYHVFMLAASAEKMHPREESHRGQRIFVVQTPGDGYTDNVMNVVKEVLGRHYKDLPLFSADAEVIHHDFPSLKDDEQAIGDCVKNALSAIKTAIDRNDPDVVKMSLSEKDNKGQYNTVHVQHRQNNVYDRGHQPVRADMVIDLITRSNKDFRSRDQIDQMTPGTRITRLGGYYDFVYAPTDAAANRVDLDFGRDRESRRDRDNEAYQLYSKRFITTLIDTVDFSPESMLLAIATADVASSMKEVMSAFEPNRAIGEDDPRNIGVLAIEPNLNQLDRGFGERWETKSDSFNSAKLKALINTTVRKGLIQSVDIPECGASTWQYLDWIAAQDGNKAALKRVVATANRLTDGAFSDYWRRDDAPIFDAHSERIHAGWVYDPESGQRIDLRCLDYVMLLNLVRPERQEDLRLIQLFSMAASEGEDDPLSMSDRYDIIKRLMPEAVITGYHSRFNFVTDFTDALVDSILDCKLSLTPTSSNRDVGERYRGTYGNIDTILNTRTSTDLYRHQRRNRDRDREYDDRRDDRDSRRSRSSSRY